MNRCQLYFLKAIGIICVLFFSACITVITDNSGEKIYRYRSGDFEYGKYQKTRQITDYKGKNTVVVVPERIGGGVVDTIDFGAFENKGLTSITLPNTIKWIHSNAFKGNALTEIILPDAIYNIGSNAFEGNALTEITFLKRISSIYEKAFANNKLRTISFNGSIRSSGSWNFWIFADVNAQPYAFKKRGTACVQ